MAKKIQLTQGKVAIVNEAVISKLHGEFARQV